MTGTPGSVGGERTHAPGWYDDGSGAQRWWNGSDWTQHVQTAGTTAGPAAGVDTVATGAPSARTRRRVPLIGAVAATGGALVLGLLIGAAGGGADDPTASEEYRTQTVELTSITDERDVLLQQAEEATAEIESLVGAAAAQVAELEARGVELDRRTAELDARTAEVEGREAAAAAAAAPQPAAPKAAAPAPAPPAPTDPQSVYYDNCSAARAAGAAPVRVGDPGYGRHLDRDGDGVGCE